jgi:hypothetical protein
MRIIIAAANFSPVVASRRAKHDSDFRVRTILGAKPLYLFRARLADAPRTIPAWQ